MTKRSISLAAFCAACAAVASSARAVPLDMAIVYQGQVKLNGEPINGLADLRFTLFDAAGAGIPPVGGLPIGATITRLNVKVNNGLFSVELTFAAAAFAGDARWLTIEVRHPAGVGAYVDLSPRQPVKATPYALYSLQSGDNFWEASGANISNNNTGFVGINRTATVASTEYFGIQAQAAGTAYGGMYIRTDSATAKPYYGYSTGAQAVWTYFDGSDDSWNIYNDGIRLTVTDTGRVGIGTTAPGAPLEIESAANGDGLLVTKTGTGRAAQFYCPDSSESMALYAVSYGTGRAALFESHENDDNPAVWIFKNNGPALRVVGQLGAGTGDDTSAVSIIGGSDSEPGSGGFIVTGSVTGSNISMDNNEIMARNNGLVSDLFLNNDGGDVIIAPQGTARVRVLQISGADVAEKFPVNEMHEGIRPGAVMEIDPEHPGKLRLARGAYNRLVAGVVSGANGLLTGTILGNLPGSENAPPIALSGRVWVECDASVGSIEPGDLLTTSDTAGHAMKVVDYTRAPGAVIGKAMTRLESGRGLVLVLVSLN
ncbi:MAG: hypothetical protein HOP29_05560 [Phycisphaerales bacterium]|nr:hypothetical protein [Phycisphaerales bacterium]